MKEQESDNRWLKVFALLTAALTFFLVWVGGLVTSHGAGMAVPDWPNTFGYNMFYFPISKWMGGIFYEHTHRLVASMVGMLTTILTLWLYGYKSRPVLRWTGVICFLSGLAIWRFLPTYSAAGLQLVGTGVVGFAISYCWPRRAPAPLWLRRLGLIAFVVVIVQGILGGFRVTQMMPQLGIFHGTVAQLFFLLVSCIAFFLTDYWTKLPSAIAPDPTRIRRLAIATTALVVIQLTLGATMRHQHAGLAIPDFPAAYGKIWPATDSASIAAYNQNRIETQGYEPITAFQVVLQMTHRIVAYLLLGLVCLVARRTVKQFGWKHSLGRWALTWSGLVFIQACLGAFTIWTGKSADIATLHVAFGALSLLVGGLFSIVLVRCLALAPAKANAPEVQRSASTITPV